MDLKLPKLPDRTPVTYKITLKPDLNRRLLQYAECYRAAYGGSEPVEELVPFIVEAFLESDRAFSKAIKDGEVNVTGGRDTRRQPRRQRGEVGGQPESEE